MHRLIVIWSVLLSVTIWGQQSRDYVNDGRAHVDRYLKIAAEHDNLDSARHYYARAEKLATSIWYEDGRIQALEGLVDTQKPTATVLEKLEPALLLVFILEENKDIPKLREAHLRVGKIYYDESLYEKANVNLHEAAYLPGVITDEKREAMMWLVRSYKNLGVLDTALIFARKLQDYPNIALKEHVALLNEKAEIYHELKAYQQELETYNELLQIIEGTQFDYLKDITWNNVGYAQKFMGDLKASRSAFMYVVNSNRQLDNGLIGGAYYNLGLNYQNNNMPDSAMIHFDRGMKYLRKAKEWSQLAQSMNMQAMVYYQQDDHFNALKKVQDAIALSEQQGIAEQQARGHEIKSYIHQDLFEYEMALDEYKKFLSIRDGIVSKENDRKRDVLFSRYRVEEFEARLRSIWDTDRLDKLELEKVKAEKEAERERFKAKEKEDELRITALENSELRAREELNALILNEQELKLKNQENELALIQRNNELAQLALEKERLAAREKEAEIELLAQANELQLQKQMREQEEFNNKLRFIFVLLLFIILVLLGILIAYRQLRKRKKQIEIQNAVIEKSKVEIEAEKEKSDGLLLNILPGAVAEELKVNGSSKPKSFKEVSVGFTDFSGFTMISEKLSAEELVHKLGEIFLEFDRIIERHGLQRIKTIGDAYMFASGLPVVSEDHAEKCVIAALEIRDYITQHNEALLPNDPKWNIRIGINTGPVVAGVIGIKKFAYDIWGDTVNTAARMESSGEVGKVNISGATYNHVNTHFNTEYRGKVPAKNKGDIDMYFVEPN